MTASDKLIHLSVEEAQQQGANVRAVDIRVSHDDDAVITTLGNVLIRSDPRANSLDHAHDFFVSQDLVFAALVGIDDFSAKRQDRLRVAKPSTFSTTTCGVTFHQIQLAFFHLIADAIAKLPRQSTTSERVFTLPKCIFCLACSFAGFRR